MPMGSVYEMSGSVGYLAPVLDRSAGAALGLGSRPHGSGSDGHVLTAESRLRQRRLRPRWCRWHRTRGTRPPWQPHSGHEAPPGVFRCHLSPGLLGGLLRHRPVQDACVDGAGADGVDADPPREQLVGESGVVWVRPVIRTRAPSSTRSRAVATLNPLPPPVPTTRLPPYLPISNASLLVSG